MQGDKMRHFRFENLDIWKESIELSNKLLDISDIVEKRKHYRTTPCCNK